MLPLSELSGGLARFQEVIDLLAKDGVQGLVDVARTDREIEVAHKIDKKLGIWAKIEPDTGAGQSRASSIYLEVRVPDPAGTVTLLFIGYLNEDEKGKLTNERWSLGADSIDPNWDEDQRLLRTWESIAPIFVATARGHGDSDWTEFQMIVVELTAIFLSYQPPSE